MHRITKKTPTGTVVGVFLFRYSAVFGVCYCFGCSAGFAGSAGAAGACWTGGMAMAPAGAAAAGVVTPACEAAVPGIGSVGLNLFGEKFGLIS